MNGSASRASSARAGWLARRAAPLAAAAVLLGSAAAVQAQSPVVYQLTPVADTSIFGAQGGGTEVDGISDGMGPNLWTSVTAGGITRRALLRFDLSSLPADAQIVSVQLQLFEVRARDEHVLSLHRVLGAWGEGNSNGGDAGAGAPAQAGDATWSHRVWPNVPWNQRGGDFVADPSSTLSVGLGPGTFTWGSTPQMVADVQGWLTQPASNHGWMLIGDDTGLQNAKRFVSRNSAGTQGLPTLIVSVVPEPGTYLLMLAGVASLLLVVSRRRG